jgi:phosphate starvation-inducible protein PhoH and related proteins
MYPCRRKKAIKGGPCSLAEDRELHLQHAFADNEEMAAVLGRFDENLKLIQDGFSVQIISRGDTVRISGSRDNALHVEALFRYLTESVRHGSGLNPQDVRYLIQTVKDGGGDRLGDMITDFIGTTFRGRKVKPKTLGQKVYVDAMRENDLVFGIGPAGTGKTYLAVAMAATALKNREVNRIVLTRPAVEAGEKLGFLPGDLQEKVDPYLRPLYDSMYDIMGMETVQKYMERGIIEVAPLAYMRGRTLDDAYIILDEAQNTTLEQMKMFLTRMGFGSKAVVTGDLTQKDLPLGKGSGLEHARQILQEIEGIRFVYFTEYDVVRHELVQKIIRAYEESTDGH